MRKGDILCVVDSHDGLLKYAARSVQYYRENAKYLERTYGFVERVGIEKIRSVVVDDSEGIAARFGTQFPVSGANSGNDEEEGAVRGTQLATRTFERWGTVNQRRWPTLASTGSSLETAGPNPPCLFAHAHTRELNSPAQSVDLRAKN